MKTRGMKSREGEEVKQGCIRRARLPHPIGLPVESCEIHLAGGRKEDACIHFACPHRSRFVPRALTLCFQAVLSRAPSASGEARGQEVGGTGLMRGC